MGASWTWQPKAWSPHLLLTWSLLVPHLFKPKSQECSQSLLKSDPSADLCQLSLQTLPTLALLVPALASPCHRPAPAPSHSGLTVSHSGLTQGPSAQRTARHTAGDGGGQVSGWKEPAGGAEGDKAGAPQSSRPPPRPSRSRSWRPVPSRSWTTTWTGCEYACPPLGCPFSQHPPLETSQSPTSQWVLNWSQALSVSLYLLV